MLARANCGLKLQPMLRQGRARSVISDLYISGSLTLMFFKMVRGGSGYFCSGRFQLAHRVKVNGPDLFKRSLASVKRKPCPKPFSVCG